MTNFNGTFNGTAGTDVPGGNGTDGTAGLKITSGTHSLSASSHVTGGRGGNGNANIPGGSGGDGAVGVDLSGGSVLTSSGTIAGGNGGVAKYAGDGGSGVHVANGSTFANLGTVTGGKGADGTSVNGIGHGGVGVSLDNGASLINFGTITGGIGENSSAGGNGVTFSGGGYFLNAGIVNAGPGADAVRFGAGNAQLTITSTAVFNGHVVATTGFDNTLELAGNTAGSISGIGTQFVNFNHVQVDANSHWSINGIVGSGVDVTNLGHIDGSNGNNGAVGENKSGLGGSGGNGGVGSTGINLASGASLTNKSGGTIAGGDGGNGGNGGTGANIYGNGYVIVGSDGNGGNGGAGGVGVNLGAGASLINQGGGIISGGTGGSGGAGGHAGSGGAGSVGVNFVQGGTLSNAGTISGSGNADSVHFGAGDARLIINPTAVFNGHVVATAGHTNTLELAGTAAGTISGIGTQFVNFNKIQVDSASHWTFQGSVGAGMAVTSAGSISGVGGSNGAAATAHTTASAGGKGTDGIDLGAGSSLMNNGSGVVTGGVGGIGGNNFSANGNGGQQANGSGAKGGNGGDGVNLSAGASLNHQAGIITGGAGGAGGSANPPSAGSAAAFAGDGGVGGNGVDVAAGSSMINNSGSIAGGKGGAGGASPGIPANQGDNGKGGVGVNLAQVGTVNNSGVISGGAGGHLGNTDGAGGTGVELAKGGTLVNAGTISGGAGSTLGIAVHFGAGNANLEIDAGAVFNGKVIASAGFQNSIELNTGATPGTISGIGTQYQNFQSVQIDAGANWTINGAVGSAVSVDMGANNDTPADRLGIGTASTFKAEISGFDGNDVIDLKDVSFGSITGSSFDSATGVFTLNTTGGDIKLDFDNPPSLAATMGLGGLFFNYASDGGGGTNLTLGATPCYCPGTLILTERGEVTVENLVIGDRVVTISGELEPIKWIGRRSYAGRFIADSLHVLPIRISANALGDGLPRRDLLISPQHAMYLDGFLVNAGSLINGTSIVREHVKQVEYIHIELEAHNVIWAEGAASETYIDCSNRGIFHNADEYAQRYPEAKHSAPLHYAPRLSEGYALESIRRRIAQNCLTSSRQSGVRK